ncbi:hypothetical protein K431DRAFT_148629 [Polychaeton citri CBS 116435]|uniref:Uncharacterized protein n=1 Tax=Polychaeton citri CBS 116435 TaxID=1314669 RepID=A0A9P4UKS7_9PEZI|nr:hypothetical protein K431DRAFT_148629 [Polychaeton citri CBS 116435]
MCVSPLLAISRGQWLAVPCFSTPRQGSRDSIHHLNPTWFFFSHVARPEAESSPHHAMPVRQRQARINSRPASTQSALSSALGTARILPNLMPGPETTDQAMGARRRHDAEIRKPCQHHLEECKDTPSPILAVYMQPTHNPQRSPSLFLSLCAHSCCPCVVINLAAGKVASPSNGRRAMCHSLTDGS